MRKVESDYVIDLLEDDSLGVAGYKYLLFPLIEGKEEALVEVCMFEEYCSCNEGIKNEVKFKNIS